MSDETTKIGRLGVWTWLEAFTAPDAAAFAKPLEERGDSVLWIPEAVGQDAFAMIGYPAAKTSKLVPASGIANLYAHDAMGTKAIWKTCAEMAPEILDGALKPLRIVRGH